MDTATSQRHAHILKGCGEEGLQALQTLCTPGLRVGVRHELRLPVPRLRRSASTTRWARCATRWTSC
jgi:hypothetical protein